MGKFGKVKWTNMGLLGFAGSGKTWTAIRIAVGLLKMIKSKRPLMVFDSEGGIEYQLDYIKKETGKDPEGESSQSFFDLVEFTNTVKEGDVVLIDSVTQPWQELLRAKQTKKGRFQGIMSAKEDWNSHFAKWVLGFPCHVIFCGRAGYEFDYQENMQTGEKELVKTGVKMKTDNDFGYEPSLLLEMQRIQEPNGHLQHNCLVKKDRFGIMDGKTFTNPNFETFKPWFGKLDLKSGGSPTLDTEDKTINVIDHDGQSNRQKENTEREVLLEEIQSEIVELYPGQTKEEKQAKARILKSIFGTGSWKALESNFQGKYPVKILRDALGKIRSMSGAKGIGIG